MKCFFQLQFFASERYCSTAFITTNPSQAAGNVRSNHNLKLCSDSIINQLNPDAVNQPWYSYYLDPADEITMLEIANSAGAQC